MSALDPHAISGILRRSLEGARVTELCGEFGISRATLFRIRARFGIRPEHVARSLELERSWQRSERRNRQLAQDLDALRALLRAEFSPEARRRAATFVIERHGLSQRRAARLLGINRSRARWLSNVRKLRARPLDPRVR